MYLSVDEILARINHTSGFQYRTRGIEIRIVSLFAITTVTTYKTEGNLFPTSEHLGLVVNNSLQFWSWQP